MGGDANLNRNVTMLKCAATSDSIQKSVADYHKRMAEFRLNLDKEIKERNGKELQKLISGLDFTDTNDLSKLNYLSGDIQSIFKYAYYNNYDSKGLADAMYRLGKQQKTVEIKMEKVKNGEKDDRSENFDKDLVKNPLNNGFSKLS